MARDEVSFTAEEKTYIQQIFRSGKEGIHTA